jgi:tellurite resistance protein
MATPSQPSIRSILSQAATSYAKRPERADHTVPTGFDPRAALLFEAVVEAAFLVANADGDFDQTERRTFETLVSQACEGDLQPVDLHKLVTDLCRQLESEGLPRRIQAVCRSVARHQHKLEVLRIAALMAHVSGGVKQAERSVLEALAAGLDLEPAAVDETLAQARAALLGE